MKKIYICVLGFALIMAIVYYTYIASNITLTASKSINNYEMKPLETILTDSKYIVQSINEETDSYCKNIYYPKTVNINLDQKIQEVLKTYIDKLNNLVENNKNNDKKYKLNINFDIICYSSDIMSIVFTTNLDTNDTNPECSIDTITYDIKNDKEIKIQDLYENNKNYLYELSKVCYSKLKDNNKIKEFGADKTLKEGTKAVKENFENFAIGENCIIFYFSKGKLAPYTAGRFKVSVSFDEVKNIFTK